nr:retrovirus-related Pol polyprotein from transposon TNT 1-94 [Tanacetum cinerariifolium]
MAAESNVPHLVDKKRDSYFTIAPRLEPRKFNKWKKRMLCYLTGMEPYYIKCIKDGPYQPKTAEDANKPESQWTNDERRVVNQDQRIKIIIISCLPDNIMESVISCETTKSTWTDLVYSFEAKPITPPSKSASEEDNDPKQAQRDKDMQKNLSLIAKYFKRIYKPTNNNLRTSLNSRNKNVDTTPRKPKRVKDSTYHNEKMLLCKQAEKGGPLQAEQYDWLADTDEEIDEQELEAHYSYMAKIQEVPTIDACTDSM